MEELLKYLYQQLDSIECINNAINTLGQKYHDDFIEGEINAIHSIIDVVEVMIKEDKNGNK